jgi:acyl-CoA thioester hydrolase
MKTFNIGPILASIQCDYLAPVTYPDTLIVFSTATQTGAKKVELKHKLWSTQQNRLVAQGVGIGVYYDYKALKSCIIPAPIAAKLAALNEVK